MHAELLDIDIEEAIDAAPIKPSTGLKKAALIGLIIGALTFGAGLLWYPHNLLWASYYTDLIFFMGLAAGSAMIPVILQIVHATWASPVRRLAEANVAFLPWAWLLFVVTYFGRNDLFWWANRPAPGKETWMMPDFVYGRFAVLLGVLFILMWRFVRMSLRGDVGLLRERAKDKNRWAAPLFTELTRKWRGVDTEVTALQRKMSWNAPVVLIAYALIWSLFAFEMVMALDPVWSANMFGGFEFIGNIYMGWAVLALSVMYHARLNKDYDKTVGRQQLWDMGKLTFAFCMLWGYMFWAQFLPQWYGNMPEETQWLILRSREYPWKAMAWFTFPMCFVIPFIMLLSEDLKKTPVAYACVCAGIVIGIWTEKFMIVMPNFSPDHIPFGAIDIGLFAGFLSAYVLAIQTFLSKFPFLPVSHPQCRNIDEW
jgi:hypothetical protein